MLFTGTILFYGLADDEFPSADLLALTPYHREGRRLRGIQRIIVNDVINIYKNKTLYRTGVSVGDYPVDHHHECNPDAPKINFPKIPSCRWIEFILQQSEHFAR